MGEHSKVPPLMGWHSLCQTLYWGYTDGWDPAFLCKEFRIKRERGRWQWNNVVGAMGLSVTWKIQGGFPRENGVQMTPEGWRGVHPRSFFVKTHRGEEKLHVAQCGCMARWWIWREIRTRWWGVLETLLHTFILYPGTTGSHWSMSVKEWHEQTSTRIQRMDWRRASLAARAP